jgi:predicted acetyltransferase
VNLRLRPLRDSDEREVLAAHAELADDDFTFLLFWEPEDCWSGYVRQLERHRNGSDIPDGMVPATFLVAEVEGELVGRVSIRHELNDWLTRVGGHIGYCVRPAHRRRGYATEILRQSLIVARAVGVERALVSCNDANVASARAIERCGGVLENVVDEEGSRKRRYWID